MELQAWWRVIRARCAPFGDPQPLAPASLRGDMIPELHAYFELLGAQCWFGHRMATDFILLSAGAIQDLLEDDAVASHAGGWLPFARRGDRVGWFLSSTGQVADNCDDSPWLAGPDTMSLRSFVAWRERVLALHWHEPDAATAIALTPDELISLDEALASADPHDILVRARDLQYRVTPDPAWRHAEGSPDRVVRLDDCTSLSPAIATEIYRGVDTTITLFTASALADRPYVRESSVGSWDGARRFTRHSDSRARLRELCAFAAGLSGIILVVADSRPEDVEQ